jgi:ribonuclease HI
MKKPKGETREKMYARKRIVPMVPKEILMFDDVFNMKTLCVFCDASTTPGNTEVIGAPGAIAVTVGIDGNTALIDSSYMLLRMSTNNESEMTAIQLGVNLCSKYKNNFDSFLVFSDSQISIFGLREWLPTWVKYSRKGELKNQTGKSIANQEIMKSIVITIVNRRLKIRFFHQKGHAHNKVENTVVTFANSNNLLITPELGLELSNWNDFVDRFTGEVLEKADLSFSEATAKLLPITRYYIGKEMLDKYLGLIR